MSDPTDNEELRRLFLQRAEAVQPYVCPLMLLPNREARAADMINCGSAGLIDTGSSKLLVTCNHVWSAFANHLEQNPEAIVVLGRGGGFGGLVINDFPLIDSSVDLDLAILSFEDPESLHGTPKRFWTATEWPPKRAEAGDRIVGVGWPGNNRREALNGLDSLFHGTAIDEIVASVSDRHLVLTDNPNRAVFEHVTGLTIDGSHGGMSGCPVFTLLNDEHTFAGIVYESSDGTTANFFISHACYVTASGAIDRLLAPPPFV